MQKTVGLVSNGFFLCLKLAEAIDAAVANIFTTKLCQACTAAAENTGVLMLLQDDPVSLQEDLQLIALLNVQVATDLDGKHDPSQTIHGTNDTGCLHRNLPPN